jgi:hypothetical protein
MELRVKHIHLSALNGNESNNGSGHGSTDVIVYLENGRKFVASFFSYSNILEMQIHHQTDGNYLFGSYFWNRNMVLVDNCSLQIIEPVVNDLIDEGDFLEAFREL